MSIHLPETPVYLLDTDESGNQLNMFQFDTGKNAAEVTAE